MPAAKKTAKRPKKKRKKPQTRWAFTDSRKAKFLKLLAETGNISFSAKSIGSGPTTVHRHINEDPDFKALVDEAKEIAADALEAEARRRAVEGVRRGIYYQGERVDTELHFSDRMLEILLKANKPEKFRERFEHTGHLTGTFTDYVIEANKLDKKEGDDNGSQEG